MAGFCHLDYMAPLLEWKLWWWRGSLLSAVATFCSNLAISSLANLSDLLSENSVRIRSQHEELWAYRYWNFWSNWPRIGMLWSMWFNQWMEVGEQCFFPSFWYGLYKKHLDVFLFLWSWGWCLWRLITMTKLPLGKGYHVEILSWDIDLFKISN